MDRSNDESQSLKNNRSGVYLLPAVHSQPLDGKDKPGTFQPTNAQRPVEPPSQSKSMLGMVRHDVIQHGRGSSVPDLPATALLQQLRELVQSPTQQPWLQPEFVRRSAEQVAQQIQLHEVNPTALGPTKTGGKTTKAIENAQVAPFSMNQEIPLAFDATGTHANGGISLLAPMLSTQSQLQSVFSGPWDPSLAVSFSNEILEPFQRPCLNAALLAGPRKSVSGLDWVATTVGTPSKKDPPFPLKLHQMLADPRSNAYICWNSDGRSWKILKPSMLESFVIPTYFRHAKYNSFMRQVNGWGFKRIVSGSQFNSYYHHQFLREDPKLCLKMRRASKNSKANKGKAPNSPEEDPGIGSSFDLNEYDDLYSLGQADCSSDISEDVVLATLHDAQKKALSSQTVEGVILAKIAHPDNLNLSTSLRSLIQQQGNRRPDLPSVIHVPMATQSSFVLNQHHRVPTFQESDQRIMTRLPAELTRIDVDRSLGGVQDHRPSFIGSDPTLSQAINSAGNPSEMSSANAQQPWTLPGS